VDRLHDGSSDPAKLSTKGAVAFATAPFRCPIGPTIRSWSRLIVRAVTGTGQSFVVGIEDPSQRHELLAQRTVPLSAAICAGGYGERGSPYLAPRGPPQAHHSCNRQTIDNGNEIPKQSPEFPSISWNIPFQSEYLGEKSLASWNRWRELRVPSASGRYP